jgi:hypothetical protein
MKDLKEFLEYLAEGKTFKILLALLVVAILCHSCVEMAHAAEVSVSELEKAEPIQLNYKSEKDYNYIDKIQTARLVEGNQELASYFVCRKERKEFYNNKLTVEESGVSDTCMALMTVSNMQKTNENTRRGENKRTAVIQTLGTLAGGIKLLTGF